ncbi:MAG TPA: ATP synthase F1 subunit epsilon [bacterium]|nr:ATP synthase F1 subunit epsilon [bacterium]
MAKTFKLQLVAPDSPALTEEVTSVILPGGAGEFGVLARHMPLISTLKPGTLEVTRDGVKEFYFLAGGYVEVNPTSVIVLAEEYEKSDIINVERATLSKKQAEEKLASKAEGVSILKEKQALARNNARLQTVDKAKVYKK